MKGIIRRAGGGRVATAATLTMLKVQMQFIRNKHLVHVQQWLSPGIEIAWAAEQFAHK